MTNQKTIERLENENNRLLKKVCDNVQRLLNSLKKQMMPELCAAMQTW